MATKAVEERKGKMMSGRLVETKVVRGRMGLPVMLYSFLLLSQLLLFSFFFHFIIFFEKNFAPQ